MSIKNQLAFLWILSLFLGCVSTSGGPEHFISEGFQSSIPEPGTKVVVWGNHRGAITQTLGWLQSHELVVMDSSWIEKNLKDPGFMLRANTEQRSQVLSAAQEIGAEFVIFAEVDENQLGRKFDLMSFGRQPTKIIGVKIRGMYAETGHVAFGAKAWNSQPLLASEEVVLDLTTLALQKAWKEPATPVARSQEGNVEVVEKEEFTDFTTPLTEETSPVEVVLQPVVTPANTRKANQSEMSGQFRMGDEQTNENMDFTIPSTEEKLLDERVSEWMANHVATLPHHESEAGEQGTREDEITDLWTSPIEETPPAEEMAPQSVDQNPNTLKSLQSELTEQVAPSEEVEDFAAGPSRELVPEEGTSQSLALESEPTSDDSLGLQIAGGALSILYTPLKLGYAGLGGIMGGLAYVVTAGNEQVSQTIWDSSLGGTYWLTEQHLQGKEPINFRGQPSDMEISSHQARLDSLTEASLDSE